jgi:C4-type Zn-finger protein
MMPREGSGTVKIGDTLAEPCPACRGDLVACHEQKELPSARFFWNTECRRCERRFNYIPATGEIQPVPNRKR